MRTHASMRGKVRRAESHARMVQWVRSTILRSIADDLYRPLPIMSRLK